PSPVIITAIVPPTCCFAVTAAVAFTPESSSVIGNMIGSRVY
nr:hypothetical protein [Tanacetum cinerariifolium]